MSGVFDKVDLFDEGSKTQDTNLLATDLSPTRTKSVFRIVVMIGTTSAKFGVVYKKSGKTDRRGFFREGALLVPDNVYTFIMGARKPKTYNFQFDTTTDLYLLEIEEIEGPVI